MDLEGATEIKEGTPEVKDIAKTTADVTQEIISDKTSEIHSLHEQIASLTGPPGQPKLLDTFPDHGDQFSLSGNHGDNVPLAALTVPIEGGHMTTEGNDHVTELSDPRGHVMQLSDQKDCMMPLTGQVNKLSDPLVLLPDQTEQMITLSDQTSHVAGLTVAALELINGSSEAASSAPGLSSLSSSQSPSLREFYSMKGERLGEPINLPVPPQAVSVPNTSLVNDQSLMLPTDPSSGGPYLQLTALEGNEAPPASHVNEAKPDLIQLTNAPVLPPVSSLSPSELSRISHSPPKTDNRTLSLLDLVSVTTGMGNLADIHRQIQSNAVGHHPTPDAHSQEQSGDVVDAMAEVGALISQNGEEEKRLVHGPENSIHLDNNVSEKSVIPKPSGSGRGRKRKHPNPSGSGPDTKGDGRARTQRDVIVRPPPHVLPPCKVCGVQATGFHYGVNTCEACKGFFRRSIIRKSPYVCANNAVKCVVSPGKRNTCPACRYKRCQEAGMSVDGIKIGRYTYAKRTQDILEMQQELPPSDIAEGESPITESSDDSNEHSPPSANTPSQVPDAGLAEFIEAVIKANVSKYPSYMRSTELVEKIQEQISERYMQAPSQSKIPLDQFLSVLNTTGIQLDDRFQVLQHWLGLLNDGVKYLIIFAKELPGFRDLSMTDQMALLKHSICEVLVISRHKNFHKDYDLYTTVTGETIDVPKALGDELGHQILSVTRRLRRLELTSEETIILKALVIFYTDRCDLEDPERVFSIHERLLSALLYLFDQRNVNTSLMLGRISAILTELRDVTESYQNYTEKILFVSSTTGAVEVPPLFLEVITIS